jgi:hypothetical protein
VESVSLSPLKMEDARRLEAMSEEYQQRFDKKFLERRRSFTIGDAGDIEGLRDMMSTGYQFTDSSAPTAALEQIVSMGGRGEAGADDIHMRPISLGRRKK